MTDFRALFGFVKPGSSALPEEGETPEQREFRRDQERHGKALQIIRERRAELEGTMRMQEMLAKMRELRD